MKIKNKFVCLNCGACCQYGSGFLIDSDKQNIAKFLEIDVKTLENKYLEKVNMFETEAWRPKFPKPFGPCIFYDEKKHCRIHKVKPLFCKLTNCKKDIANEFYEKYFVNPNNKLSTVMWNLKKEIENKKNENKEKDFSKF